METYYNCNQRCCLFRFLLAFFSSPGASCFVYLCEVDISFDSSYLRSPLSNCSHGGAYALLPFSSFFRLRRVPRSVSNLPSRRSLACLLFGYRRFSPTFSFSVPSPLPLSLDYLFSWRVLLILFVFFLRWTFGSFKFFSLLQFPS